MNPELNREYPDPDEAKLIEEMVKLAVTIGVQDVDSTEGRLLTEECETMAFSPWNALAEHRPMGGINRMRQAVYLASQAKRASKKTNGRKKNAVD